MCGIVGYIGGKQAAPLLLQGLEKLEYRGYDSAGLAVVDAQAGEIAVKKARGRLRVLEEMTDYGACIRGTLGIGHTRWATHGEPNDINSHPHLSLSGRVALVHNGIVENYAELRQYLSEQGYSFVSDTDTEIVVQLIDHYYADDPVAAVRQAVSQLRGSFALGIVFADRPDLFIALRKDSPLVVGLGRGENFIASDVPALLAHTRRIIRLGELEMAVVTREEVAVYDHFGVRLEPEVLNITWDAASAEKGGYEHFMLKEIMEQPEAFRRTVAPRVRDDGSIELGLRRLSDDILISLDRIYIVACGSSYHVGMVARYGIERMARVPVTVALASEFRYDNPMIGPETLVIIISQSGETLDTLFALREAKEHGARILSIVNVVGSSIAVESTDVLYTWAGPEIAVATTKAYSTQLALMQLFTIYLARVRGRLTDLEARAEVKALLAMPEKLADLLKDTSSLQYLASLYFNQKDIFFMGRNLDYALALEGSLKLKEISYIHSEAYAAGELKHGTISLIEPGTLCVALCTGAKLHEKMISNIREVKARGATVIAITAKPIPIDPEHPASNPDHIIELPDCGELCAPSLSIVPLQLFAYYVALLKGCDIDKPRNLAKSVTVE
jgi:glucosamine--fructose-6-phosphate aminotransferase (isomerizing)